MAKEVLRLRPLGSKVVILPDDEPNVTKGGILLPDNREKEASLIGTVVSVGPGAMKSDGTRIPMNVEQGDKVVFPKWAGSNPKLNGIEYRMMDEQEILAVIY